MMLVITSLFVACSKDNNETTQKQTDSIVSTTKTHTTETTEENKSKTEYSACVLSEASAVADDKYSFSQLLHSALNEDSRAGKEYYCLAIGVQTSNCGVSTTTPQLCYKDTDAAVENIKGEVEVHTFFGTETTSTESVESLLDDEESNLHNTTVFLVYSDHKINADDLYVKYSASWNDEKEIIPIVKSINVLTTPTGVNGNALVTINGKEYVLCIGSGLGGGGRNGNYCDYRIIYVWNISEPFSNEFDYSGYSLEFYNPKKKKIEMIREGLSPFLEYEKDKSQLLVGYEGPKEVFDDISDDEYQDYIDTILPVLVDKDGNKIYFCNL